MPTTLDDESRDYESSEARVGALRCPPFTQHPKPAGCRLPKPKYRVGNRQPRGCRRVENTVPEIAKGRSGVKVVAARGKRWKERRGRLRRKDGNRRGCLSCRGFWTWRKERFGDGREPLRRVRNFGSVVWQAIKKVRRPWGARQQKPEAFEKGGRFGYAAHAGTKDSTDAAQRVPTFKAFPERGAAGPGCGPGAFWRGRIPRGGGRSSRIGAAHG